MKERSDGDERRAPRDHAGETQPGSGAWHGEARIRSARLAVTPEIEQEAERLLLHSEGHIPRLEAATVTITGPVDHHARGPFEVHVTFATPHASVTTSRTREDSLRTALQDAFGAAEHRLRSRLDRRRTLTRNAAVRARAKRRGSPQRELSK